MIKVTEPRGLQQRRRQSRSSVGAVLPSHRKPNEIVNIHRVLLVSERLEENDDEAFQ